jgi:hypothetical protein
MGSLRNYKPRPIKQRAEESVAARIRPIEFVVTLTLLGLNPVKVEAISAELMSEDNWTAAKSRSIAAGEQGEALLCLRVMAESEGIALCKAPTLIKKHFTLLDEYAMLRELPWYKKMVCFKRKSRMKQLKTALEGPLSDNLLQV